MLVQSTLSVPFISPVEITPAPLPSTWEELLPEFVKSCLDYPNDRFEGQFEALRKLKPTSFLPFYPVLMLLLPNLDNASLERFINAGRECDYHTTYACCAHFLKTNPKNANAAAIKAALKKIYPQEDAQIAELKHTLSTSLAGLIGAEASKAIPGLITLAAKIKGSAVLQPWVALGWTLKKNFAQARAAIERSFTLLDRESKSPHLQSILASFIDLQFTEDIRCPEVEHNPRRLQIETFIKLHESEALDIAVAKQFVDASVEAFTTDASARVFCYFGLKHILSLLKNHHSEFRGLFQSIAELQKLIEVENVFYVDIRDIPSADPEFVFDDHLHLTEKSEFFLEKAIAMQCHLVQTTLFDIEIRTRGPALFLPLPLPKKNFLETLVRCSITLDRGEWGFYFALNYLRNYFHLPINERPYKLSKEFCTKVLFAIFTSSAPQFLQTTLDASILNTYYPSDFKKLTFDRYCNLTKNLITNEGPHPDIPLAVRDVLLAASDIDCRKKEPSEELPAQGNPYSSYSLSKRYFNWRPNETDQTWAERIKKQPFPKHDILNYFHQFWKEFHFQTPFNKNRMPEKPKCLKPAEWRPSTYLRAQAAALLVNAEDFQITNRATVETEEQAAVLCCLLIDISVDRIVRKAFASGAENLKDELSVNLALFHGSFRRLTKNCYQVGVATRECSIANTYIFF